MNVIEHGNWVRYQPDVIRADAPLNTMFCRRESDGVDWYDYVHPGGNFNSNTVKFTAMMRDGVGYVVGAATVDATALFPADHIVGEIADYAGSDPQGDFGNKVYDPATGAFTPQPDPQLRQMAAGSAEDVITRTLAAMSDRITKLEKRVKT